VTNTDEMPEYEQASDVLDAWDDEDRRRFAIWMSNYAPEAVMRYELTRRQLPRRSRAEEAR
jgi:hypothetical protein